MNYNVPIKKLSIASQKVTVTDEKVSIAPSNLPIEDVINRLDAKKNIKENAKKLFAFMNFDGVFGRSDIMEITSISITAAGNLLNILKNAGLIEAVRGYGNGKYKFVAPK